MWHTVLDRAWALLVAQNREQAEGMAAGLVTLVPLQRAAVDCGQSATSVDAFGCVALTQPVGELDLALTLVHEFQHSKLAALHDLVALHDQVAYPPKYHAPWRDDPRPLDALFHGAYAHLGVAAFWRRHRAIARGRQAAVADEKLAYWLRTLPPVLHQLRASGRLTDVGRRFVAGMTAAIEEWRTEPLPAATEDQPEDLVRDRECV
jgi:HEXXH motif-containing protein